MENRISWDQLFMGIAELVAKRSEDPHTQVGAVVVSKDNKIKSTGHNGFPSGVKKGTFPLNREGDYLDTKYPFVVHAELNAILNSTSSLKGCTIYVGLFPCNECAKSIIQSGITRVVYKSDKYKGTDPNIASKRLFDACGVEWEKMISGDVINLDFRE